MFILTFKLENLILLIRPTALWYHLKETLKNLPKEDLTAINWNELL